MTSEQLAMDGLGDRHRTFHPSLFTPTEWDSAKEKARFANHFVRFVNSDFRRTIFAKWFYTRLSMTFGHIAHYNIDGFYHEFFTSLQGKVEFLLQSVKWRCYGDPRFTYCDVERALQAWIRDTGLVDDYRARFAVAVRGLELKQLAALKAKYEP